MFLKKTDFIFKKINENAPIFAAFPHILPPSPPSLRAAPRAPSPPHAGHRLWAGGRSGRPRPAWGKGAQGRFNIQEKRISHTHAPPPRRAAARTPRRRSLRRRCDRGPMTVRYSPYRTAIKPLSARERAPFARGLARRGTHQAEAPPTAAADNAQERRQAGRASKKRGRTQGGGVL